MRLFAVPIFIMVMLLPDIYIYRHFLKRRKASKAKRIVWWLPAAFLFSYLLILLMINTFEPGNMHWFNLFLLFFGIIFIPKFLFAICSALGCGLCRIFHSHRNYGNLVGILLALCSLFVVVYGATWGMKRFEVRHTDMSFSNLPDAFDGYRIVQFSDAHVGSYGSDTAFMQMVVDSINAQHPDAVMFCGDLENVLPSELYPFLGIFPQIKAADGIYSVMGNHDYSTYTHQLSDQQRAADIKETENRQIQFGWNILLNSHRVIRKGNDSIIVAGEENDGLPPFPALGNIHQALRGTAKSNFIIMLQHDPSSWRRHILPESNVQLTLSGHTHAMQFQIFGWSPASLMFKEWGGTYYDGERALSVSKGLGGFIYFRYGAWPEINVITLHKKQSL